MNSPGKILKLWNKLVRRHEEGKKPAEMPKKGQEQKFKIKKGLTTLKFEGASDLSQPPARDKFLSLRDKVAKLMKKYCRYLKTSKDEDKKALPKFLKNVKQLTILVEDLDPGDLDQNEDDAGLEESLAAVDVSKLDQELEKPDTEPTPDDDFESPALDEIAAGKDQTTKSKQAAAAAAERFKEQFTAVSGRLEQLTKANPDGAKPLQAILNLAVQRGQTLQYDQGLTVLAELDKRLQSVSKNGAATKAAPTASAAQVKALVARWQQARDQAVAGVQELESKLRSTGDVEAVAAAAVVDSLAAQFPDGLDGTFAGLQQAVASADAAAVTRLKDQAKKDVKSCLEYLAANQTLITICENNLFGAKVDIRQPLAAALKSILTDLK